MKLGKDRRWTVPMFTRWGVNELEKARWGAVTRHRVLLILHTVRQDSNPVDLLEIAIFCIPIKMVVSLCTSGYSYVFYYKIFYLPDYKVSLVSTQNYLSSSLNPKFSICLEVQCVFCCEENPSKIKLSLKKLYIYWLTA